MHGSAAGGRSVSGAVAGSAISAVSTRAGSTSGTPVSLDGVSLVRTSNVTVTSLPGVRRDPPHLCSPCSGVGPFMPSRQDHEWVGHALDASINDSPEPSTTDHLVCGPTHEVVCGQPLLQRRRPRSQAASRSGFPLTNPVFDHDWELPPLACGRAHAAVQAAAAGPRHGPNRRGLAVIKQPPGNGVMVKLLSS